MMEDGRWKMEDVGVTSGNDLNKKALQRNANQNFSLFTIHYSLSEEGR